MELLGKVQRRGSNRDQECGGSFECRCYGLRGAKARQDSSSAKRSQRITHRERAVRDDVNHVGLLPRSGVWCRAHCQSRIVSYRILARPASQHGFALLCLCLNPWSPRVRAKRGVFKFNLGASIADDRTHTRSHPIPILPLQETRCASYGGGSVAHARSYARIDGRDQAIMTRHISLQSLPLLALAREARNCWQTGEPSAAPPTSSARLKSAIVATAADLPANT